MSGNQKEKKAFHFGVTASRGLLIEGECVQRINVIF